MAARNRSTYRTGVSAAYAPVYDGNAVRVTRRQEEQQNSVRRSSSWLQVLTTSAAVSPSERSIRISSGASAM